MNFIGRKEELNTLEKEFRRDGSFVVIYGRRRIGKTTLIKEFIKDKQAFYFLATEEVESQSMKRLAGVVARVTGNSMLQRVTFTDWLDLFREIANYRPEEKKVLVMNEARFSNIFIEKRASTCPQSLEKSRLFSYALLVSECENFQNMKRIFLRKVVI